MDDDDFRGGMVLAAYLVVIAMCVFAALIITVMVRL